MPGFRENQKSRISGHTNFLRSLFSAFCKWHIHKLEDLISKSGNLHKRKFADYNTSSNEKREKVKIITATYHLSANCYFYCPSYTFEVTIKEFFNYSCYFLKMDGNADLEWNESMIGTRDRGRIRMKCSLKRGQLKSVEFFTFCWINLIFNIYGRTIKN